MDWCDVDGNVYVAATAGGNGCALIDVSCGVYSRTCIGAGISVPMSNLFYSESLTQWLLVI